METVKVTLEGVQGEPLGSMDTDVNVTVTAQYTSELLLKDGTIIPRVIATKFLGSNGKTQFEVYPCDGPEIADGYDGVGVKFTAIITDARGRPLHPWSRTVKVSTGGPWELGLLPAARPFTPEEWKDIEDLAGPIRDAAEAAADAAQQSASDAQSAATDAAHAIRDNLATDINTPGSPAYLAIADVAGSITDPAITSVVSRMLVDAKANGVTGDGETNDAAALNTLIADVSSDGGGVIVLPVGTYICIGGVNGASNVTLRGADRDGTIIRKSGSNSTWINTGSADNFRVENLTIDGNHGVTVSGLTLGEGDGCVLDGVTLKNFDAFAVRSASATTHALITRSLFDNCNTAVRVDGANDGLTLDRNIFRDWQDCAVYVSGDASTATNDVTITGNIVLPHKAGTPASKVRQPIRFHGDDANHHRNVVVRGNTVTGMYTNHQDTLKPGSADLISLHRCTGFEVSGNTVRGGGDVGITIAQGCRDGRVFGNLAHDNDTVGLCLGSAGSNAPVKNITVTGNAFRDNALDMADTGGQSIDRAVERAKSHILAVQAEDCVIDNNVLFYRSGHPTSTRYAITWRDCTRTHIGAVGVGNKSVGHTSPYYSEGSNAGMTTSGHAELVASPPNAEAARFVLAGIPIIVGNTIPEGVVTAPRGALYLRTGGAAGDQIYYKNQDGNANGWTASSRPPGQNEANLGNASHPINTSGKAKGVCVFNNTKNQPVWASNGGPTDPWFDATGHAAVTPS